MDSRLFSGWIREAYVLESHGSYQLASAYAIVCGRLKSQRSGVQNLKQLPSTRIAVWFSELATCLHYGIKYEALDCEGYPVGVSLRGGGFDRV
jgi:hypothetical protein